MPNLRLPYRSLYWRIGVGFIVCIAAVLAVQGSVLLWLLGREEADWRTQFTSGLSQELAIALADDPQLDVEAFVNERVPSPPRSFYVVLKSGAAYYFGDRRPVERAIFSVREELSHGADAIPHLWEVEPYWASPIYVRGELNGIVSVVARDAVAELWRPMAVLAVALLILGTILASRFIFGPAHRRLKALEATALLLGAGDASARADEDGGDEVAALAQNFNVMARDLSARAAQIASFDRTRRLLLADISHELMTPLTAIRGYQEKLAADPAISTSPQRRRYLGIIGEEALRLERTVRDLLDLARFEGGGHIFDVQDVSVEGLFGRVAARQEADATARGVQIRTAIDRGAEIVRGDQFRLEQALQNLAANALRHVPEGGSVELHAAVDGGEIVVTVRDTGTGIAEQHLPHIFDRFYKQDASRVAGVEGSGLGLSIVKAIVERHGGSITVASRPNVETTFTVRLPAGADAELLGRSA